MEGCTSFYLPKSLHGTFFSLEIFSVCVSVCVSSHAHDTVCMWRLEDNFQELILSIHLVSEALSLVSPMLCTPG